MKRKHRGYGDTFYIDEVFVKINGKHITYGGRLIRTEKLRSYGVAQRKLMPDVIHDTSRYANNLAEQYLTVSAFEERARAVA